MQKGKRNIIIIAIIALITAFVIYRVVVTINGDSADVVDETANVKVTNAAIQGIEVTSPVTGHIRPKDEVSIIPKAVGEVTAVHVELGDKVNKGALLFTIDSSQMQNALAQASAGYAQANDLYNQAVISYDNAKDNYDRVESLYNEGAVSKQQYEQAKFQLDSSLAAVNQAKNGILQAQAVVESASDNVSNARVTAPISGYITAVNVVKGGMASQAVAAVCIANTDALEINSSVSENLINKIDIGDTVKIVVKSVSDDMFSGVITHISPAPATGSLTYPIKISITDGNTLIKPGMFAEVIVASESISDVLTLPSDAVIIKGGKTVVATTDTEKVLFKEVVCGIDNGQRIEIISGITAEDLIIYEGQYYLEDDDPVKIIQ